MSQLLSALHLTPEAAPSGLEKVCESPSATLPVDEQVAIRELFQISPLINYVFFRRFADGRSSQVAACVICVADELLSQEELKYIHQQLWLSGITPLLYVDQLTQVDILSCAKEATTKDSNWHYCPVETIKDINSELNKISSFSSYRLADGTFWESNYASAIVDSQKSAHNMLIEKVKKADSTLDGAENPLARRLLLLTLLIKYLEDRKVFPNDWFSTFHPSATCFIDILKSGSLDAFKSMLYSLEERFNGDIFTLSDIEPASCPENFLKTIHELTDVIDPSIAPSGQYFLWNFYSFEHIPVEVLSHIYQHFAEEGKGAFFTPPRLVSLLLDSVMPFSSLKGDEKILDPTCGSGIFLVAAFRRLIQVRQAQNNKWTPSAAELTTLLSQTIFGIEVQKEAAHITSFSLALGICDALRPEVIWNELRFDNLINCNIQIGKFEKTAISFKEKTVGNNGFDIILGNPPFQSKLDAEYSTGIPDRQTAYYIFKKSCDSLLAPHGQICMIQPAGVLYNLQTTSFRHCLFNRFKIQTILDFVSIRGLFEGADTKVVVLQGNNQQPDANHSIHHWTFRRNFTAKNRLLFELDHYDHHVISQEQCQHDWIWRANLFGGGRLYSFMKTLSELPKLADAVRDNGWAMGEGYISGDKKKLAPWFTEGMLEQQTSTFTQDKITPTVLEQKHFSAPRPTARYHPPLMLIKENVELSSAYWDQSPLAYNSSIVGISASEKDAKKLKKFHSRFLRNRELFKAVCYLFSTRLVNLKATSIYKNDIDQLPWPSDEHWALAKWEKELVTDINDYLAEYVRKGQISKVITTPCTQKHFEKYQKTFVRLMQTVYPDFSAQRSGISAGLAFQSFSFANTPPPSWLEESDWANNLRETILKDNGGSLQTVRLLRIYDGNTLLLIKPNILRYWIPSTAIWDADNTFEDILRSGASCD